LSNPTSADVEERADCAEHGCDEPDKAPTAPPPNSENTPRRVRDTPRVTSEESTTPDLNELQRLGIEAVNRRDFDAMLSFFAPAAVWDLSPMGLGMYEGSEAIRRFFEDWIGAYEEFAFEAEQNLDLGNGVSFAVIIQNGRPVGSSGTVRTRYGAVTVREDGLVVRMMNYPDIDEARAVAERLAESRG
jgi:ketosteroid isomerase-like protein